MSENDPQETNAQKVDVLAISAAKGEGEIFLLLTVRLNPYSYGVTELLVPLHQARERFQTDLSDLLERSPIFNSEQNFNQPPFD